MAITLFISSSVSTDVPLEHCNGVSVIYSGDRVLLVDKCFTRGCARSLSCVPFCTIEHAYELIALRALQIDCQVTVRARTPAPEKPKSDSER